MVPEQREALDEIIVKIRSGRITRRTFLERAIALGLTSSVAGSLLEACGGGGGGSSGPTSIVWQTENDTSGTYPALVDTYNKTNKDNVHVIWHNGPSSTDTMLTIYDNTLRARSASFDVMQSIISIMRGKTSKSRRMFLLAGIASVCALRWHTVHVVVAQEAAR